MRLVGLILLMAAIPAMACSDLLDQKFRPLAGKEAAPLCDAFENKVLLIVNTASKCGFTPQYEGLEALHAEFESQGFAVLGFPSNDFLGQEPGTEAEIKDFCTLTYGVKFPMFEKTSVKGKDAHPLYQMLTEKTGDAPGWNFHKYLIDRNGQVIKSFGSRTKPTDETLRAEIVRLLAEAPKAKANAETH